MLTAVKQHGSSLRYAAKSLKVDRELVLKAVKQDGYALEYADKSLKADRKIVLAAVKQEKDALDYASEALQKDQELRKIAGKNDDITESDIAEFGKSKPEKIQAYYSAWELEKEYGVFSIAKGKKIKEVEGYRIWENKSSVILFWKLPKSKKDLFRVLEMSKWKDSDISFDELDGPDSSKGYGSTNYDSKGKELSSVEDFDGYGDTNSDFGSDYYSTEITILFKGKKSVKFSESSKEWSVGLSGGEQKTLKDYDAVVAVIKKIIK